MTLVPRWNRGSDGKDDTHTNVCLSPFDSKAGDFIPIYSTRPQLHTPQPGQVSSHLNGG